MFWNTIELVAGRYSIIVQTCIAVFVPLLLGGKVSKGRASGDVVVEQVDMMGGYSGGVDRYEEGVHFLGGCWQVRCEYAFMFCLRWMKVF